jgi:uncharacterized protein (TIGR02145 family)
MEPFIETSDPDWVSNTNNLKERLAGLMVYNLTTVAGILYPGVWTWDGTLWITSQKNTSTIIAISQQPKAFTFYELGTETPDPLVFTVSGGESAFTYQWYRITGNNIHVRVAEPLTDNTWGTGATTNTFTPSGVLKGTTLNANNTGFYRFYCVAKNAAKDSLISNTAEIAVGCGAKNKEGEWLSFMCFNLGADHENATIAFQKNYTFTSHTNTGASGLHPYQANEEDLFGDLFQWGRIADGHEGRQSTSKAYEAALSSDIVTGGRCASNAIERPVNQVKETSSWYGKFIINIPIEANTNWNPVMPQTVADQLWMASGRNVSNDPCAHYNTNGTYFPFWHPAGIDGSHSTCVNGSGEAAHTNWRIPTQSEWGELFRGGMISGDAINAMANTWRWHGNANANPNNITDSRGMELLPDNLTTTLFLPASGQRNCGGGGLYQQGSYGYYWSSTAVGTSVYFLSFSPWDVYPSRINNRSEGFAIRCIKHQ